MIFQVFAKSPSTHKQEGQQIFKMNVGLPWLLAILMTYVIGQGHAEVPDTAMMLAGMTHLKKKRFFPLNFSVKSSF